MGDTHDGTEPSLELPGLFGRKRKQPKPAPAPEREEPTAVIPQTAPEAAPEPAPAPEPTQVLTPPAPVTPAAPPPAPEAPREKRSRLSRRGLDKLDQQGGGLDRQDAAPVPADEPREPRELKLPPLPSRVAAAVTGIVVGLVGSVLTWAALQGCEALRGTDSCGGPGFFILLLILAVMIVLGAVLLLAWEVSDAKSTSALAIGIVCVVVLMLLMEQLLEPWMFVVVPVMCALSYLGSHLLTTTLADEDVVT